jgi:2-oxoglutarate/2-oxoacid ferredoxin oxidoreductase subunit alpha
MTGSTGSPETAGAKVNDFVIKLANVNGTGSASANTLLMKVIFRMGVPVTGKNFFPSNIQGLPTWYEIRVSKDGYLARSGDVDVMVAMNSATYVQDLAEVSPGGTLIYDSTWPRSRLLARTDVTILGVPFAKMCNEHFSNARTRILMKNMAYVGALAALLDLDLGLIRVLIEETFARKEKLIGPNMEAIDLGFRYAKEHFDCPLATRVAPLDRTAGHILIDGNTAAALGCVYAGATVGAWYPITPSTSLMDAFRSFCEKFRKDPHSGERSYIVIQAEDELAAIGIVLGATWNGARAFTPTSGPGLSLMSEFLGFAYFAELPAVVFDVQRVGPSTGMPTRTQQSDLLAAAFASHGDTRHVLLFPANPKECFEFAVRAFDLADRLQTPVLVMSDLDIGMNDWMSEELRWDANYQWDRGKVLDAEALEKIDAFHRYLDQDGDGIAARTLPGAHPKGAYFVRGSGHNRFGAYTEDSTEYQIVLDRLTRKFQTAKKYLPRPVIEQDPRTDIAICLDRQFGRRRARGARHPARARRADELHARARLPVQRGSREVPGRSPAAVRRRAESRCAAALAADARDARGQGEAALAAALQRPAGVLEFHRRWRSGRVRRRPARQPCGSAVMTFIPKPKVAHPSLPKNALGLTRRDYEGALSTLCAGCGHDSITAAIIEACWGISAEPHDIVKLSGIGCSSKTTAYFVSGGHGFNSVHGRMPSIAMGANAANRKLRYIGISGDGDTLSIGLGQFCHAIRRNVNMLYIIENNGVYGLTKGQFSASADIGTKAKKGEVNVQPPIDRGAARHAARRGLRRAQLLGRQGAADPADPGGSQLPRLRADRCAVTLRHVQRPRRLHQELCVHARALRAGRQRGLRALRARDQGRLRRGRDAAGRAARRQPGRAAQARCELRPRRCHARAELCRRAHQPGRVRDRSAAPAHGRPRVPRRQPDPGCAAEPAAVLEAVARGPGAAEAPGPLSLRRLVEATG